MSAKWAILGVFVVVLAGGAVAVQGAEQQLGPVKVIPLGSHEGEFCRNDRAFLFEDPTGVRILYDPGRTIAGGTDERLGAVHTLLVSSAHSDHIGDTKRNSASPGTCTSPSTVPAAPVPNAAEIAAAKSSAVLVGGELPDFFSKRIAGAAGCPATGLANELVVPRTTPCVGTLRHGGKRTVRLAGATDGVQVAVVTAHHSNGVPTGLLTGPEKSELEAEGLTAYVGPENGYVLTFTNGLAVYLSGDTGLTADMAAVVHDFYKPKLAIMNVGDIFSLGPEEGAFAVERLVKPSAVIPSHVNEAATQGGVVRPGTRTERFLALVERARVHVPRSGAVMEFDGRGRCVAGCG